MPLDYETLKAFMHPALLDSFPETDPPDNPPEDFDGRNATLKAALTAATQRFNALTANLPSNATLRFDSMTFVLKMALCHIYEFILHDTGYLTQISLTGLSISENQVWEHFKALLDMERADIDEMTKSLLDEIAEKEKESKQYGVLLYHSARRQPR